MGKKTFIDESIELDEKQTPSDKVFNVVSLLCGAAAAALLLICLIFYFTLPDVAVLAWIYAFYPIVVFVAAGTFCSAAQLLRNRYFTSVAAFILNIAGIVAAITVLIVQAAVYKEVFIAPFIYF